MNHKHLIVAALLLGASVPVAAQSVKSGIDAWQRSDYESAVRIWRPLAEQGDPDAQFNLAQAYRLGRGVPTNLAAAQIWLERAAVQGHLDAQTTLGLLLFQNGDHSGGIRWLKSAAEKNDARAMLVYGTALFNGDTVTQDTPLGYAYVSRAAAQGLAPAKATLAQMQQVMSPADRKKGAALMAAAKAQEASSAAAKPGTKSGSVKTGAAAQKPPKSAAARKVAADNSPVAKGVADKAALDKTAVAKPIAQKAPPAKPVIDKATKTAPPAAKAVATPPVRPTGSWRIQLGAFSQRGTAEALFRKLSGTAPVSGRSASYSTAGAVTRLQVGPFESKAAADEACRTLASRGQACFAVPGR